MAQRNETAASTRGPRITSSDSYGDLHLGHPVAPGTPLAVVGGSGQGFTSFGPDSNRGNPGAAVNAGAGNGSAIDEAVKQIREAASRGFRPKWVPRKKLSEADFLEARRAEELKAAGRVYVAGGVELDESGRFVPEATLFPLSELTLHSAGKVWAAGETVTNKATGEREVRRVKLRLVRGEDDTDPNIKNLHVQSADITIPDDVNPREVISTLVLMNEGNTLNGVPIRRGWAPDSPADLVWWTPQEPAPKRRLAARAAELTVGAVSYGLIADGLYQIARTLF